MRFTKRALSLSAAAFMLTAALCQPAMAAPGKTNLGTVAKVSSSAVTVDGKKDAIYDKGLNVKVQGSDEVSADTWFLWTDGYMYFYADVTDPELKDCDAETKKTTPWTPDNVELFIDDDNDGKDYAMQYRVDFTGYGSWKDRSANKNYYTTDVIGDDFKYAAVKTDKGYTAEMRVPLNGKVGNEVGFNIQASFNSIASDPWKTSEYNYFVLGEPVKADTPVTDAPKTADPISLVLLAAAASGLVVFKKKH